MNDVIMKDLTYRYSAKEAPVIDDYSLTIKQGEVVGIVGASGSGKSTLLRLIAGLEMPEQGSITIDNRVVVDSHTFIHAEDRGVGLVFQDYALFPHLTVAQNIVFGLNQLKRAERRERLVEMLDLVQLGGYAKRYPHELSGGQQQRVALARALAPKPSILLMDEPFSNLDADLKAGIRQELQDILHKAQITCLLVSHDQQDIEAICSRAVNMNTPVMV